MANDDEQQTAQNGNGSIVQMLKTISIILGSITALFLLVKIAVDIGEMKGTIQATLVMHQQEIKDNEHDLEKLEIRLPPLEKHMHESYEERAKKGEGTPDGYSSKKGR